MSKTRQPRLITELATEAKRLAYRVFDTPPAELKAELLALAKRINTLDARAITNAELDPSKRKRR